MHTLQFAQPAWILVGLIFCAGLILLLRHLQKKRGTALEKFAASKLLERLTRHVSPHRRLLKSGILVCSVFLLFIALARPQYGFQWIEVKRKGIDILFALDTSRSMLAEDIKPNRLQRARFGILDFVSQLQGDRIGLIPFAGSGYLMSPLTLDYDAFTQSLNSVTTNLIPKGGTNIGAVIEEARSVLDNDANHKILILITDGENLQGDVLKAAQTAHEQGMTIHTVGVGTAGGELIPLSETSNGSSGFVKDEEGKYVTSKLDERTLEKIAGVSGGIYTPLGNSGEGLERIYQEKLKLIPKENLAERRRKVPTDRFTWPLLGAVVLLFLEFLIPERKPARPLSLPRVITKGRRKKKHITTLLLFGFFTYLNPHDAGASEAFKAYENGDYLTASELYSQMLKTQPDDPVLHFNYGTVTYKNNLYDEAVASFSQALKSDDLTLQEKAYFNRGNAHYQKGLETQQAAPQATIDQWEQSLTSYEGALQLNPQNKRATENKKIVERKLEELRQQLKQQQQESSEDEQTKQQDNQNNQQKNSSTQQQEGNEPEQQDSEKQQQQSQQKGQDKPEPEDGQPDKDDETANPKEKQANENQPEQRQPDTENKNAQTGEQKLRKPGEMTKEEAESLLNALKNEEGELNFVPRGQESVQKDW